MIAAGHTVRIADIVSSATYPEISVLADLRNPESLRATCAGCDVVYNLGAVHRDDVRPLSLYDEVNVAGSENLCRVAEELGIQTIVFTSSVAVYGLPEGTPDETAPFRPFNAYGRTKAAAEAVHERWQAADPENRSLTIVRPTVVFGPGNRGNVYNLLRQIAGGRFVMIGKGTNRKSMAYVDNVSGFLAFVLRYEAGVHRFNYVDRPDFDMNTLVSTVRETLGKGRGVGIRLPYAVGWLAGLGFDVLARLTGRRFPISRVRVKKFCASTAFSGEKMAASGYRPPVVLADAVKETVLRECGTPPE